MKSKLNTIIRLLPILMLCFYSCSDKNHEFNTKEDVPFISTDDLVKDFADNMIKAEQKYNDKYYIIEGYLAEINRDTDNNAVIGLYSLTHKKGMLCYFHRSEEDKDIATLSIGKKVKVKGKIAGIERGMVIVVHCKIVTDQNNENLPLKGNQSTKNESNKNNRKVILDAIRVPVQNELKQEVKFVVYRLNICNNYAVLLAKPVKMNGSPVEYANTEYQEQINDGVFDDGVQAILNLENNVWVVKNYVIGATDSPVQMWVEQFGLSSCKDEFGIQ